MQMWVMQYAQNLAKEPPSLRDLNCPGRIDLRRSVLRWNESLLEINKYTYSNNPQHVI